MEPFHEISREWAEMRAQIQKLASEMDEVKKQLAQQTPPELLTFSEFSSRYPSWTEGRLRWKRFHQNTNGFAPAFAEDGARVLVNPRVFFDILANKKSLRPSRK